jgi:secondary thiamine-phosphate synthase enzyme
MTELRIHSRQHAELVDITGEVQRAVTTAGLTEGVVTVYVPHTTAGLTIQENADPDVARDLLYALDRLVPWQDRGYRHGEGNSAAHVKAALLGHSAQVLVGGGRLQLGTWQGIFFCEFDGPRSRKVWLYFSR